MNMELVNPSRQELEALSLADRVALEGAMEEALPLLRQLNDEEITRLVRGGASLRALAEAMGCGKTTVERRLARLGLETHGQASHPGHPVPQNGDTPEAVVTPDAVFNPPEPNPADRPAHHLPDVVAPDADSNLRTQALHWFEQGRHLEELIGEGVTVDPRDRADRAAIKREAGEMVRIARLLKGAT